MRRACFIRIFVDGAENIADEILFALHADALQVAEAFLLVLVVFALLGAEAVHGGLEAALAGLAGFAREKVVLDFLIVALGLLFQILHFLADETEAGFEILFLVFEGDVRVDGLVEVLENGFEIDVDGLVLGGELESAGEGGDQQGDAQFHVFLLLVC